MTHPPVADPNPFEEQPLLSDEVKARAVAGVAHVGLRGIAIRLVGLVGGIVLARLLVPEDFGVVAFGLTLVNGLGFLSHEGLGVGFIRRPTAPQRADLEALVGLQLAATTTLGLVVAAMAWGFGPAGALTLAMVASLPIAAFKSPNVILLERALSYRLLALTETLEVAMFHAVTIAAVLLGAGSWGFAFGAIARSVLGTAILVAAGPARWVRPRANWGRIRGVLRFGTQYQAIAASVLVRDQALNFGTAAIAGVPTLGLWTLATRLLHVPFVVFESMWRVSYPAMSRLLAAGEALRPVIERGMGLAAVGGGLLLVPLVGAGPDFVSVVFGERWREAQGVIPLGAVGLMIAGPVSVAATGYLFAMGQAGTVLKAVLLHSVAYLGVGLSLLPVMGVSALGAAGIASGLVDASVLGYATARRSGARVVAATIGPVAAAAIAAAAGWGIAARLDGVPSVLVGAAAAEALFLALVALVRRDLLVGMLRLATRLAGRPRRERETVGDGPAAEAAVEP